MMRKPINNLFGVGIPSIIMIFIVVAVGVLSSLTLITANAEYQLAKKSFDQSVSIYKGDNEIENLLALLDEETLENSLAQLQYAYSYDQTLQQLRIFIPVEENQKIIACIDLPKMKVIQWQLVSSRQFQENDIQNFNQIEIGD